MSGPPELTGPDLAQGIPLTQIPEGDLFAAHAFGKPLVVVRRGDSVRAIGAQCTHYGGALAAGGGGGDTRGCPPAPPRLNPRPRATPGPPPPQPGAAGAVKKPDGRG